MCGVCVCEVCVCEVCVCEVNSELYKTRTHVYTST